MSLLKYINFDIKYSQYCDVPPPSGSIYGNTSTKKEKMELERKQKNKKGRKKKEEEICCADFSRFKPI